MHLKKDSLYLKSNTGKSNTFTLSHTNYPLDTLSLSNTHTFLNLSLSLSLVFENKNKFPLKSQYLFKQTHKILNLLFAHYYTGSFLCVFLSVSALISFFCSSYIQIFFRCYFLVPFAFFRIFISLPTGKVRYFIGDFKSESMDFEFLEWIKYSLKFKPQIYK